MQQETPILWSPDVNSRLIGKDFDAGKELKGKGEGVTEYEMFDNITNSMDMNF